MSELPVVCLVVGMAGSGKSTLMHRLASVGSCFCVNLDPAVTAIPYGAHVDIRSTVDYPKVMQEYSLGPNGAIVTSLNLFATKFHQVVEAISSRKDKLKYVFVDTPGQIEIFTWSASGAIIAESLASQFPTVLLYVVDTPRTKSPLTFMSNMLYACSILYKFNLPFLLVFNKNDVCPYDFAKEWMADFDVFNNALKKEKSYASSLAFSLSLVLEEFYAELGHVGVSAITGSGMPELFSKIDASRKEYAVYLADLKKNMAKREKDLEASGKKAALMKEKERLETELKKGAMQEKSDVPAFTGMKMMSEKEKEENLKRVMDDLAEEEKRAFEEEGETNHEEEEEQGEEEDEDDDCM